MGRWKDGKVIYWTLDGRWEGVGIHLIFGHILKRGSLSGVNGIEIE